MFNTLITWLTAVLGAVKVWGLRTFYRLESAWTWRGANPGVPHIDLQVPVGDTDITARLYTNSLGQARPMILYIHGGGWVIGDLQSHHPFCAALSHHTGCTVIALDYRLAPENPFPAAQDDCLAATRWIAERAAELAPCNGTLVIAGDSAGGNLATCTCLELDEAARAKVIGELLIYPATDHYSTGYSSYIEKATGQALTTGLMQWFWNAYLGNQAPDNPEVQRAFPIRAASLASLPPTLLVTAENDPLRDEGIAYVERLREAGVPVEYHHFEGADHGFACGHGPGEHFQSFIVIVDTWIKQLDESA